MAVPGSSCSSTKSRSCGYASGTLPSSASAVIRGSIAARVPRDSSSAPSAASLVDDTGVCGSTDGLAVMVASTRYSANPIREGRSNASCGCSVVCRSRFNACTSSTIIRELMPS